MNFSTATSSVLFRLRNGARQIAQVAHLCLSFLWGQTEPESLSREIVSRSLRFVSGGSVRDVFLAALQIAQLCFSFECGQPLQAKQ